jgi:hypothetical protein
MFVTSQTKMINIPMYRGHTGFQRFSLYDPALMGEVMEEDEFLKIIDASSKLVQLLYIKKRNADNLGISPYKLFMCFMSLLMFFAFVIIEYQCILTENFDMEIVGYGLFSGGFIFMGGLTLYESTRESRNIVFKFTE